MSTIWTPSGERPIPRDDPAPLGEEERAQMADLERELASTPASVVVVNYCIGLFQLAALHLGQEPPKLEDAKVAIDAMGAIVEGLGPRLGDDARALEEALTSVRLGFVQAQRGAHGSSAEPE